ncbi:replication initiation protein [Kocuria rosea]|uniref:replication initiation protein n=1 Tax=Kocuria rosea TaxID=1275 RepID=UPI0025411AE9|nr:replication initiation protein [Kocuria rosea]WIG19358.1 replication initiation protein [Kocuria rosea]
MDPALLDIALFCPETPARRFLEHHRIEFFRCGQTKSQAFPNRGRPAGEFAFLQLNPADWLNFLVVDVDDEDALLNLMHPAVPEPTWIIENPQSGHAQAGWAIEPVYRGEGARLAPIRYAEAVQRALDRLVDGDPCFTRYLVRNPAAAFPAGRVWWGRRTSPWSLGDLKAHMTEYIDPFHEEAIDGPATPAWDPGTSLLGQSGIPRASVTDTAPEVGRNTAIFRSTRRWLWDQRQIRRQVPTEAASIAHARALNAQLPHPLSDGEVACLARSAVRQVHAGKGRPTSTSGSDAAHEYLVRMGRRGGKARTEAKVRAAADNAAHARRARTDRAGQLRAQAAQLRAAGATYRAIAEAVGRTARTVMAWLKNEPAPPAGDTVEGGEVLQATGIGSAPILCPVPSPSLGVFPAFADDEDVPVTAEPAYQWPEGVLPGELAPDFRERLSPEDRGLTLWVPLDYLEDYPVGSGYWAFTSASAYWETTKDGAFYGRALGGGELHVTQVGARVGELHGLRFPHLRAVTYEVTRVAGETRWSARFPGYIVH